MGLFDIGRKNIKPRQFGYEPRFFDPNAEERERRLHKRSIEIERKPRRTKQPAFIAVALALLLALYIYVNL